MYRKRFDLVSSQAMRRLVDSDITARSAVAHRLIGGNFLEGMPDER